jgi:hypothetical protein
LKSCDFVEPGFVLTLEEAEISTGTSNTKVTILFSFFKSVPSRENAELRLSLLNMSLLNILRFYIGFLNTDCVLPRLAIINSTGVIMR